MIRIKSAPLTKHIGDTLADLCRVPRVATGRSAIRYATDIVLAKAMNTIRLPNADAERTIRLRDGTSVTYRLNRGDVQSLREVFALDTYRPPDGAGDIDLLVDLGANIGLTSLYFARRMRPALVLSVEPDARNAGLLARNLSANAVPSEVVRAAVGSHDGTARFAHSAESNTGHLDDVGEEVRLVSLNTLLSVVPGRRVGLMKIDVEGAERELLTDGMSWLQRVDRVLIEIHEDRGVNHSWCIERFRQAGFRYIRRGRNDADLFVRIGVD